MRARYGITVTAFHRPGTGWSYTSLDTVIEDGDIILIAGESARVEEYSLMR